MCFVLFYYLKMNKLKAYAKINLNLHLLPNKLKSGFYPIRYINCQINLFDDIFLEKTENKIVFSSSNSKGLPKISKNLAYKAAVLLKNEFKNKNFGAKIKLIKNIPIKAGFGGGSSDAALVILSLIKLWKIKVNEKQLFNIANQLGKEVFYYLKGGVCEVLKDGTLVNKINNKSPKIWLVLVSPKNKKPSTEYMFKNLNNSLIGKQINKFNEMKKAFLKKNIKNIIKNLHNDFEIFAIKKYPEILKIKTDLKNNKAESSLMTGAGLYIVGYFRNKKAAVLAYNKLRIKYKSAILTHTK